MSELNTRCLDAFPEWLKTLPEDAVALSLLLEDESLPESARKQVAGSLNYLFKSLDLIPDGIEDLGFLDDAFVIRVAARVAAVDLADPPAVMKTLAAQAALVEELLGKDFVRLAKYVDGLVNGAARGRTAQELVSDAEVRSSFRAELDAWSKSYQAPSFSRDEKNLVKLTSFLSAKLPG
jgi:uncharacterized membrane protein YkvA (DUF1232 family)